MDKPNIQEIIAGAAVGESQAIERLIKFIRPAVQGRLAAKVRDVYAREDLFQEICLTVCRQLPSLRDPARLMAWVGSITDKTAMGWMRRKYSQARLTEALTGERTLFPVAEADHGIDPALKQQLAAAFRTLSQEHQTVLRKHYLEGRSYSETAMLLQIEPELVRSRLQKARHQLKRKMSTMTKQKDLTIQLTREDLQAFRAVATHAGAPQPGRDIISGICLAPGGRIVATDGRALIVRQSARLAGLTGQMVIGPCQESSFPDADEASLHVGLTSVTLEAGNSQTVEYLLMTQLPYPNYEAVIPQKWPFRLQVQAGAFLQAVKELEPMLEAKHPPLPELKYIPSIDLRLDVTLAELTLVIGKFVGYDGCQSCIKKELAETGDWTHSITLPGVRGDDEKHEEVMKLRVNAHYLRRALQALGTAGSEPIEVRLISEVSPLGLFAGRDAAQFALVMPLRMN